MKISLKQLPAFLTVVITAPTLGAQTVFQDTYETSLTSGTGDINFEINDGRQSGGTTISNYTTNGNNGSALLNVTAGGPLGAVDLLLLRTNTNGGAASNAGATLDANFGTSLENLTYNISFTGYMSTGAGAGTDRWMSIFLAGASTATSPNAAGVDYGILLRDRDTNNVTQWQDGSGTTTTATDPITGISPFAVNTAFTVDILVNEGAGTATTTFNIGTSNELALAPFAIDFEGGDAGNRFLGVRANQGAAGGLVDFRYDDLQITVVPEASHAAGILSVLAISFIAFRRWKK
ncbi:hypothetical protein [Rubellicoccus peritrichatus]|uniref:Anchor protein n=1 Tax=Rubellicoccus peritrichatus TaxID=3080537 RepID=A0AAQ3QVC5_9BACT|nr:hypothetical protein [Puniceicoccus sp. CR14]WOO43306.1 hypothetical protein RZN69_09405 [Puniceicoccus sp. CR14]